MGIGRGFAGSPNAVKRARLSVRRNGKESRRTGTTSKGQPMFYGYRSGEGRIQDTGNEGHQRALRYKIA